MEQAIEGDRDAFSVLVTTSVSHKCPPLTEYLDRESLPSVRVLIHRRSTEAVPLSVIGRDIVPTFHLEQV